MFQPQCGGYSRLLSAKPGRWSNQVPIPGTEGGRSSTRLNSFTSKKPIPQARMKPLEPVSLIRTTVQGMSMPQWKWSLADFPLVLKAVNSLNLELPKNWKYFPQLQRKTEVIENVSQQPNPEEINVTEQPHVKVQTDEKNVASNTLSREGRIRLIREQLEDVPVAREEHDFEKAMTESDASVKWFYNQSGAQIKGATVTEKRVNVVNKKTGPAAAGKDVSQTWQQLPNVLQKTSKYLPSFSKAKEVPSDEVKKAETLKKNLIAKRRETGIVQTAVKRKTRSLVASLRAAEMTSSKLLRLEELCRHLVEHPESTTIAIKERLVPCLLSLKKTKDRVLQEQVHEAMALIGHVSPVPARGTRVLSMDGGGTRGLMTLQTLLKLQEATGKEPHQLFDYIIGVSTGALLAAMVGVFRVPLKECIQLYKDFSSEMFTRSRLSGAKQLVTSHAYYDSKMWESILRDQFGEVTFVSTARDKKCPKIAMVSTLMNQLKIQNFLFRNYNLPPRVQSLYPGSCHDKLWQGIRASSAAPGYYEELKIDDNIHQDGGLLTNNPTAIALHECKLLWPNEQFSCIVSIGTGRYEPAVDKMDQSYSSLKTKLNKFVQSATDTEAVHNLLHDLLPPKTYYRFNPYMSENFELDEVNPSKWLVMEHDSQMYLRKNEHKIQAVAKQLSLPRRVDQKAQDWIKQQSDVHASK